MKFVPQNLDEHSVSFIDVNAMIMGGEEEKKNSNQIFSCEIPIGKLDLSSKDANLLQSLDEWLVQDM